MRIRLPASAFIPSALAFVAAVGMGVILVVAAESFEGSFLKMARHDIRIQTEEAIGEFSAYLKAGNLKAVREYAEDVRPADQAGGRSRVGGLSGRVCGQGRRAQA